jgi:hypothetical protein
MCWQKATTDKVNTIGICDLNTATRARIALADRYNSTTSALNVKSINTLPLKNARNRATGRKCNLKYRTTANDS